MAMVNTGPSSSHGHSCMPLPRTYNDRALLGCEPFRTHFKLRDEIQGQIGRGTQSEETQWSKNIKEAFGMMQEAVRYALAQPMHIPLMLYHGRRISLLPPGADLFVSAPRPRNHTCRGDASLPMIAAWMSSSSSTGHCIRTKGKWHNSLWKER
jgi:hypothetical protein